MGESKVTVAITTYNQKETLLQCLEWIRDIPQIANVIVVDNGSEDGTAEILPELGCGFIYFDEGIQGYGKVWNAALANFDTEETVVFLEPQFFPGKKSMQRMEKILRGQDCGIAAPICNGSFYSQNITIKSLDSLCALEDLPFQEDAAFYRSLDVEHGIWALSRKTWQELGMFEEKLCHPKNVLLDYKLRLVENGRQPIVCRQAFAYCLSGGSISSYFQAFLRTDDRKALKDKWHMNYFNVLPSRNLVDFISEQKDAPIRVLEVGCDLGATLLEVKNRYPNSQTYGLEINGPAADIAGHLAEVKTGDIEKGEIPFAGKFDYIIFADVLEHLHDPHGVVRLCQEKLAAHGHILASNTNLMHISVMEQLLSGRFQYEDTGLLDRSHIHFFTFYEIRRMFQDEGYELQEIKNTITPLTEKQEKLLNKLLAISENVDSHMYETVQYLIKAGK